MALWHRIRPTGIERFSHHCKRWRHSLLPEAAGASVADHRADRRWRFGAHQQALTRPSPTFLYAPVRSFAAPVQAKPKQSADALNGPRINGAITAAYVRLVTDEGHGVVSKREALDRAMKLNLDLVEVQRTASPPVCKIMDFHKEKFKQEVKEKERAKSKSAVALRNGENKEVRFKAKTELKDLKIKAETVTRLMERGYRVKCTAMPTGKEEEDLGGLLSRLLALIEDVAVVESGPHVVDTRQAYVIVRHVKFATKKPGKKASQALDIVSRGVQSAVPNTPTTISSTTQDKMPPQAEEEWETVGCSSETESEVLCDQIEENTQQLSDAPTTSSKKAPIGDFTEAISWSGSKPTENFENVLNFDAKRNPPAEDINSSKPLHKKLAASKPVCDLLKPKPKLELKKEQTDVQAATAFVSLQSEPSVIESNRYSKRSEPKGKFHPTRSKERIQYQTTRNESEGRGQFDPKQRQFNPGNPSSPSPGYGIFNAPKPGGSGEHNILGGAAVGKPSNPSSPTPSYGIFSSSKTASSGDQRNSGDATLSKPRNLCPPTPRNGIFSTTKPSNSSDQRSPGDATMGKPSNPSSPTPSYGIFSASRTAASGDQRSPGDVKGGVEESKSTSTNNTLNISRSGVEKQGRWGVFSRETSPINQHRASDSEMKVQR